jgi:hypothetical protein
MKKLTYAAIFATLIAASTPTFAADRLTGNCKNDANTIVNLLDKDIKREGRMGGRPTEYHFPKEWGLQQQYFDCLRYEIRRQTKECLDTEYDFIPYGQSDTEIKYLLRKREAT